MKRSGESAGLPGVIARRVLTQMGPELRQITVSVAKPRRHPDGDWQCAFMIEGLNGSVVQNARGVDALQALQMAIEGVRVNLERTGRRFIWLDRGGGPEIPRYIPTEYGPRFEARLDRMLEYEAKRFWETKLKDRKANLAALEADVKLRKEALASLEAALERRKKAATNWAMELKERKPSRRHRP